MSSLSCHPRLVSLSRCCRWRAAFAAFRCCRVDPEDFGELGFFFSLSSSSFNLLLSLTAPQSLPSRAFRSSICSALDRPALAVTRSSAASLNSSLLARPRLILDLDNFSFLTVDTILPHCGLVYTILEYFFGL